MVEGGRESGDGEMSGGRLSLFVSPLESPALVSLTAELRVLALAQLKDCSTCLSLLATGDAMLAGGRRGSFGGRGGEREKG